MYSVTVQHRVPGYFQISFLAWRSTKSFLVTDIPNVLIVKVKLASGGFGKVNTLSRRRVGLCEDGRFKGLENQSNRGLLEDLVRK